MLNDHRTMCVENIPRRRLRRRRDETNTTRHNSRHNHVAHKYTHTHACTELCVLARCIAMARLPVRVLERNACVICTSVRIWGAGKYCLISNAARQPRSVRLDDAYVFVADNNYVFINCCSRSERTLHDRKNHLSGLRGAVCAEYATKSTTTIASADSRAEFESFDSANYPLLINMRLFARARETQRNYSKINNNSY